MRLGPFGLGSAQAKQMAGCGRVPTPPARTARAEEKARCGDTVMEKNIAEGVHKDSAIQTDNNPTVDTKQIEVGEVLG